MRVCHSEVCTPKSRSTQTKQVDFEETTEESVIVSISPGMGETGWLLWPWSWSWSLPLWFIHVSLPIMVFFYCCPIFRHRLAVGACCIWNVYAFYFIATAFLLLWLYCVSTFPSLMKFSMLWETLLFLYSEKWYCGQVPRSVRSPVLGCVALWSLYYADHLAHPGQKPCHWLGRCSLHSLWLNSEFPLIELRC